MGNAGSSSTRQIVLDDGTYIGKASDAGSEFAAAIRRMHHIFHSCDPEFHEVSQAVNLHGKTSDTFRAAAEQLQQCQRHREWQMSRIESTCGPPQDQYKLCVQRIKESGRGHESQCLPALHAFIDCAERALAAERYPHGARVV